MTPAVTFIIPVYNGLPYLREAIESVLRQSSDAWHLVIADDCSQDGSRGLIGEYADHPRITVTYNTANRGLYGSVAATISEVRTEWVSILMQDDRLKPCYLEEVSRILERHATI